MPESVGETVRMSDVWSPDDQRSYYQWGHEGRHHGIGTPDCPRDLHHHHDERCDPPPIVRLLALMSRQPIGRVRGRWSRA